LRKDGELRIRTCFFLLAMAIFGKFKKWAQGNAYRSRNRGIYVPVVYIIRSYGVYNNKYRYVKLYITYMYNARMFWGRTRR
jgi:hypothetical protein